MQGIGKQILKNYHIQDVSLGWGGDHDSLYIRRTEHFTKGGSSEAMSNDPGLGFRLLICVVAAVEGLVLQFRV